MGDRDWPLTALPIGETFAIGIVGSNANAPNLILEFRSDGTLHIENRDRNGHLARAETNYLTLKQMADVRRRAAAFRPPDGLNSDFLPRGCSYVYDSSDKATLMFASGSQGIRFVHLQNACRSPGAEVAIDELRSILASMPQSALIADNGH